MFTIIGGDGKEYGPVSVDQVRAWMAGGRANLTTKVRAVGSEEWKAIADVPEITGSASPPPVPGVSVPLVADRVVVLDILSCYDRSWTLLKANFWPLVGLSVVICVVYALLADAQKHGLFFLTPLFKDVLLGAFAFYFLRRIRGQPATIADAFKGVGKPFGPLVAIGLVTSLFVTVGIFCLIIPGIYLLVAYLFAAFLAVDKGLGFWDAMETSRRVITRNWWRVFGLILLGIPFMILGALALGVGILVAIPLVLGAYVYAYEDLCNSGR
jgi:uncharacterized membrane protein